jgi:hypothetical protein
MLIVAIAWIYVVLMMSLAEHSVVAGIMTFLLYGVLPLGVILYLIGTPQRKRKRQAAEKFQQDSCPTDTAPLPSKADASGEA